MWQPPEKGLCQPGYVSSRSEIHPPARCSTCFLFSCTCSLWATRRRRRIAAVRSASPSTCAKRGGCEIAVSDITVWSQETLERRKQLSWKSSVWGGCRWDKNRTGVSADRWCRNRVLTHNDPSPVSWKDSHFEGIKSSEEHATVAVFRGDSVQEFLRRNACSLSVFALFVDHVVFALWLLILKFDLSLRRRAGMYRFSSVKDRDGRFNWR